MHIRTKFDGGKQVNRSQAGSWNARCTGAGLRCNEGAMWGPKSWQQALSVQPLDVFQNVAAQAEKETENAIKRKASDKAKLQWKKARYGSNNNSILSRRAYSK